jgi:ribosome recycling factor
MDEYLEAMRDDLTEAHEALEKQMMRVRTGRASPRLVEGVQVLVASYGSAMPLNQLATVQAVDARMLTITPWDKTIIGDIERAIVQAGLGLNPGNDGALIRLPVPPLTADRRQELVRMVRRLGEDSKVRLRKVRKEYNDLCKSAEKDGELTEDQMHQGLAKIQEMVDASGKTVDGLIAAKEAEVQEI